MNSQLKRISFFVELPFDPGVRTNSTFTLETSPPLLGTEDIQVETVPGVSARQGVRESVSLWFRRVNVEREEPDITALCWGAELGASNRPNQRAVEFSATSVQMTRLIQVEEEAPEIPREESLSAHFDVCLDVLNRFLVAIGISTKAASIGPVTRAALPALVPFVISDPLEEQGLGDCHRGILMLNFNVPGETEEVSLEDTQSAVSIVAEDVAGRHVFLSSGEFLWSAFRLLSQMRHRQAVVEAQTGFEVLCDSIIRSAGGLRGLTPESITQLQQLPFRNKVEQHLGTLLDTTINIQDENCPFGRWWAQGYRMRNRVVHDGYTPTAAEAANAVSAVSALFEEVGRRLAADPVTNELARYLLR